MKSNIVIIEAVKFIFVGLLVTSLHLLFVYFLTSILHLWYLFSTILSYICAVVLNFVLQKYVVRKNVERNTIKTQFVSYAGVSVMHLGINAFAMYIFVSILHWHYLYAQGLIIFVLSVITFFINRNFIFR